MNNFNFSDLLTTIPAFIVAIVILVGVHEFGHFWVARRLGIRVLRFSIGIGKPIWRRVSPKDGVEYVVSAIPLGGYVKLLGERSDDDQPIAAEDLPHSFNHAPVWKRVLVLLAGPAANLVLAVFFYWVLLLIGTLALKPVIGEVTEGSLSAQAGLHNNDLITAVEGREVTTREDAVVYLFDQLLEGTVQLTVRGDQGAGEVRSILIKYAGQGDLSDPQKLFSGLGFEFWHPEDPALIETIAVDSPAQRAGLKPGDLIIALDGHAINNYSDLVKSVSSRAGQNVRLKLTRSGSEIELPIAVGEIVEQGKKIGRLGVGRKASPYPVSMQVVQKLGPISALSGGVARTWDACVLDLRVIGQMLTGKLSVKNLSGAVGIAEVTGHAARQGLLTFIALLAFISVNLGILNLLPIPVLDGGQVVYQLIELVKGSPVSERVQLIAQQIGIAALIMLVSLTLYNDIARHLS